MSSRPVHDATSTRRIAWKRLFQYRLYTLLIVITIVTIWLAWWSHSARRQRDAVATLTKMGTDVVYDFEARNQNKPPHWPAWLVETMGVDYFADVHYVNYLLDVGHIADSDLEYFKNLTSLRELDLSYQKNISDAGLEHLKGLTSLEYLDLTATAITDAGLEKLKGLTGLRKLNLNITQVTDKGLEHLNGLTGLQELRLQATRVSDAAAARLKKSLPNCKIYH